MREFWPKFIAHHNDAKWHDDDFASMRTMLRLGMVCVVIDFAQNYSHEPRFENQSKYFSQVQSIIVPVVLMARVEDMCNITEERRAQLISYFDEHNLPHVVAETHFVISSDLQHDNAIIQKIFDDFICPYLKEHAPNVRTMHVRSDGCKVRAPRGRSAVRPGGGASCARALTGDVPSRVVVYACICRPSSSARLISTGCRGSPRRALACS